MIVNATVHPLSIAARIGPRNTFGSLGRARGPASLQAARWLALPVSPWSR